MRPSNVERIFFRQDRLPLLRPFLKAHAARKMPYREVEEEELRRLSQSIHHEGIVLHAPLPQPVASLDGLFQAAQISARKEEEPEETERASPWHRHAQSHRQQLHLRQPFPPQRSLVLLLDGVDNDHNLGACIRSAAFFGASLVVPKPLSTAAARVARGGSEIAPHLVVSSSSEMAHLLAQLSERALILGADARAASASLLNVSLHDRPRSILWDTRRPSSVPSSVPVVVALGNEGDGLSSLVRSSCHSMFQIPPASPSVLHLMDSLNVSAAAAVILSVLHSRLSGAVPGTESIPFDRIRRRSIGDGPSK